MNLQTGRQTDRHHWCIPVHLLPQQTAQRGWGEAIFLLLRLINNTLGRERAEAAAGPSWNYFQTPTEHKEDIITANILLNRPIIPGVCTAASCVLTLGGTGALLVSDGTSSLVTASRAVSQNPPPTMMVNQMGALPVTPDQMSRCCSGAHGQDAPKEEGCVQQ